MIETFQIEEVIKTVNFSTNGRGLVECGIKGHKCGNIKKFMLHSINERDEGPAGYRNIQSITELYKNFRKKGMITLFNDDAFMVGPRIYKWAKIFWYPVMFKDNSGHFIVDLNRSFKRDGRFRYTWSWSKNDMFSKEVSNMKYFTQIKIEYPIKMLSYRLVIGSNVLLKGLPKLVKINKSGKETLIKRIIRRPESPEFESFGVSDDSMICNHYWIEIPKPEVGSTYKIVWELKQPKGGIANETQGQANQRL